MKCPLWQRSILLTLNNYERVWFTRCWCQIYHHTCIIVCFFGTFWNEMLLLRRDSNTLNSAFLPTQNRYPIWVLVNLWKIKQYNCMGFLLPNYCDFMTWNLATIYWRCFRGRKENKFLMSHFEKTLQDMLKPFFHEITYWIVNIFLLEEQENEPL